MADLDLILSIEADDIKKYNTLLEKMKHDANYPTSQETIEFMARVLIKNLIKTKDRDRLFETRSLIIKKLEMNERELSKETYGLIDTLKQKIIEIKDYEGFIYLYMVAAVLYYRTMDYVNLFELSKTALELENENVFDDKTKKLYRMFFSDIKRHNKSAKAFFDSLKNKDNESLEKLESFKATFDEAKVIYYAILNID